MKVIFIPHFSVRCYGSHFTLKHKNRKGKISESLMIFYVKRFRNVQMGMGSLASLAFVTS